MLPPLPRCSGWAYSSLISPSRVSLPRKGHRVGLHIVLFEACSAFTRVAACALARSPYFVTRYPKASDISSPPCLLRLLPAGAIAGWDLHPLESAAFARRTPNPDILKSRGRPLSGDCDTAVYFIAKRHKIDGLGQQRLGAAFQSFSLGLIIAIGGDHYDRNVRPQRFRFR